MYKVTMKYGDGTSEEDDEVFATESEAEQHGLYLIGCHQSGGEILHLSNPGDHPPPSDDEEVDFEIIDV